MPDDITPFPVDHESTIAYLQNKIPEWHNRLRNVELSCADTDETLKDIKTKVQEIHAAMVGSVNGYHRGYSTRIEFLETWKKTVNWALGVLYIALTGSIVGLIFSLIGRRQ